MIVENKEARLLCMTVPGKRGKVIRFFPGMNDIPDEVWGDIRKDSFVADRIDGELAGVLVEIGKSPEIDAGLKGLSPLKALEIIKGTLDLAKLAEWKGKETRKKIVAAIERQESFLNAGREG